MAENKACKDCIFKARWPADGDTVCTKSGIKEKKKISAYGEPVPPGSPAWCPLKESSMNDETPQEQTDDLVPIIDVAKQKLIKWHQSLVIKETANDCPDARRIIREAIEAALELRSGKTTETPEDSTMLLLEVAQFILKGPQDGPNGPHEGRHDMERRINAAIQKKKENTLDTKWGLRMVSRAVRDLADASGLDGNDIVYTSLNVLKNALDNHRGD